MSTDNWLLTYGMLSAYCLAGGLMEHFAVFSGWKAVSSGQFRSVQTAQGHGSGAVYVLPQFALTAVVISLLVVAPDGIPAWPLWAGLSALAVWWIVFAVQLPIQLRIRQNADRDALERLLRIDWIRVAAIAVNFGCVIVAVASN